MLWSCISSTLSLFILHFDCWCSMVIWPLVSLSFVFMPCIFRVYAPDISSVCLESDHMPCQWPCIGFVCSQALKHHMSIDIRPMYMILCLVRDPMSCIACSKLVYASYVQLYLYMHITLCIVFVVYDPIALYLLFKPYISIWSYGCVYMSMDNALYPLYVTLCRVPLVYTLYLPLTLCLVCICIRPHAFAPLIYDPMPCIHCVSLVYPFDPMAVHICI